jgi:acyl-CoA synthetase (NDP forming)
MISEGVAPLQGMEDGLRAVAHASRYGTRRSELNPEDLLLVSPPDQATEFAQVNEADAKIELAAAGLRVPLQWRVQPGDDLQEITCQCVLKAIVPELQHKTEAGAVMLDLAPSELAGCISEMQNRLAMQSLLADEFLVEEMITGVVGELLVGLRRVPGIGVVLTLAMGGVAVELTSDATSVILPARRAQIEHALRSLPLFPMIAGYRGRPVADLKLILDNIEALAEFMTKRSVICELEINPLILTESDVVIVDALLTHTRKE